MPRHDALWGLALQAGVFLYQYGMGDAMKLVLGLEGRWR